MSDKEKIFIDKESYYQLIADLDQQRKDWETLSEYVDLKIEINPSSTQYKNIRSEMDHIKGGSQMVLQVTTNSKTQFIVEWLASIDDFLYHLETTDKKFIRCISSDDKKALVKISDISSIKILDGKYIKSRIPEEM